MQTPCNLLASLGEGGRVNERKILTSDLSVSLFLSYSPICFQLKKCFLQNLLMAVNKRDSNRSPVRGMVQSAVVFLGLGLKQDERGSNLPVETELVGTVALMAAVMFPSRVRRLLTSWLTFDPSCSATISRSSRASSSGLKASAANKVKHWKLSPCCVKTLHHHQRVLNNEKKSRQG